MALVLVFLVAVGAAALIVNCLVSVLTFANTRRIMSQSDDLSAAVNTAVAAITKLKTDTATSLADIAAKLATLAATQQDPKLTAAVSDAIGILNQATADLGGIDTSIVAADPGTGTTAPPPVDVPPAV